jgi:DNA-binding MarR family transcriptional regulator
MTRQGAGKIVATLRDRHYVTVKPSSTSGRDKVVKLTPRAADYLRAQRTAVRTIERQLRRELGDESFTALNRLLETLGGAEQPRMRDYLHKLDGAAHSGE